MSESELPPLPDDVAQELARAPAPALPPGFADAVRARLQSSFPGGPGGGAAPSSSPAPAPRLGRFGFPLAAASLMVGTGAGWFLRAATLEPRPPVVAPAAEVSTAPPPSPVAAAPTPAPAPPVAPPAAPAEVPPPVRRHSREPSGNARDLELATERSLIERARTALIDRKPDEALEALEVHGRRFAAGQFAEEREALEVQAYAARGDLDRARELARAFHTRFPNSLLSPVVDAAAGNP